MAPSVPLSTGAHFAGISGGNPFAEGLQIFLRYTTTKRNTGSQLWAFSNP